MPLNLPKHRTAAGLLAEADVLEKAYALGVGEGTETNSFRAATLRSCALALIDRLKALRVTIHVARNELLKKGAFADDEDYRMLLRQATESTYGKLDGKQSAKDMHTLAELDAVMRALRAKGFRVRHKVGAGSKPAQVVGRNKAAPAAVSGNGLSRPLAQEDQDKKIRALWLAMYEQGIVKNPSEEALALWVKREFQVDALQWLTSGQCQVAIERMKKWQSREWAKRKQTPEDE